MITVKHRVYLEEEAPRLGCGWRTVLVREGRKWAHLRLAVTDERLQFTARMRIAEWRRLRDGKAALKRRVKPVMRARSNSSGRIK